MTERQNYYVPGADGKWSNVSMPETLEDAQERIKVLEQALAFYDDARTYRIDSQDNEYPTYDELMEDCGVRARIGRLATTVSQYSEWSLWALQQTKKQ